MTLRVVGAGFPRTGTTSLRVALEQLLGRPCYHMRELIAYLDHVLVWRDAFRGEPPDWREFLAGYAAGVDWPFSRFWRELSRIYPDAVVLLSRRESPQRWHASMDATVLERARALRRDPQARHAAREHNELPPFLAAAAPEQLRAMDEMWEYMGGDVLAAPDDPDAVMAGYERHLAQVRAEVPAERLVEWQPSDGWEPLCAALGVRVPDEPFPHHNSTAEMRAGIERTGFVRH